MSRWSKSLGLCIGLTVLLSTARAQGPVGTLTGSIGYSGGGSAQWNIQPGSILVVDRGTPQEETVVVTDVDPTNNKFQATFLRAHPTTNFGITMPGNPGPQPQFRERHRPLEDEACHLLHRFWSSILSQDIARHPGGKCDRDDACQ